MYMYTISNLRTLIGQMGNIVFSLIIWFRDARNSNSNWTMIWHYFLNCQLNIDHHRDLSRHIHHHHHLDFDLSQVPLEPDEAVLPGQDPVHTRHTCNKVPTSSNKHSPYNLLSNALQCNQTFHGQASCWSSGLFVLPPGGDLASCFETLGGDLLRASGWLRSQ